jgi:flavin reductase (DIM6/NTAB) family NADH-FMN oxidoreductase RutF
VTTGPSERDFRDAVSRFATGLTVVTCQVDGVDHAMTANSFTSVSLEPLLVLVCVDREARFHEAISATSHWAVSILDHSAVAAARWLATKGRPLHGQLDTVPHTRGVITGAALVTDALVTLECRTYASHPAGDHDVVLGQVIALSIAETDADPLLYYRRRYRTWSDPAGSGG